MAGYSGGSVHVCAHHLHHCMRIAKFVKFQLMSKLLLAYPQLTPFRVLSGKQHPLCVLFVRELCFL